MSEKNVKFLRGQVRQVVKELLPQVLNAEAIQSMNKDLISRVDTRLASLTDMVKSTLDQIDQRSQDMQSYVVRNVAVPAAPEAAQPTNAETTSA